MVEEVEHRILVLQVVALGLDQPMRYSMHLEDIMSNHDLIETIMLPLSLIVLVCTV